MRFEYTLSLADGTVLEKRAGNDILEYVHGEGQILSALEDALAGLAPEDQKSVQLQPNDAYGPVNADAFREVPLDQVPDSARVVGTQLRTEGYEGAIRVHEIRDDVVVLDFNHPLAGRELNFEIRIVSVE